VKESKLLQVYIDEAKRNALSTATGWSCTLLTYVEDMEKTIKAQSKELLDMDRQIELRMKFEAKYKDMKARYEREAGIIWEEPKEKACETYIPVV
jgi:hypothetical protein